MYDLAEKYDIRTAAAWVLGHSRNAELPFISDEQKAKTVDDCSEAEQLKIVADAEAAGLKLYPFKRTTQQLARTKRTLGFLHSISFETMLDVGSGRGVFLIPFIKEFPWVSVTSLDLLERRVTFLNELSAGGFGQLRAEVGDICEQPFADNSFDVITLLEVLEHIPKVEAAISAAVNMARQFVVVTVPSKPDNNPEHIHLLTKDILTDMFSRAGCTRLHFDGVEGHLFLVGAL